jgi:hypothetical protein
MQGSRVIVAQLEAPRRAVPVSEWISLLALLLVLLSSPFLYDLATAAGIAR